MDAFQGTALVAATITMGIAAGVYLLYVFAIMPGLAKTDDRTFVGAYQQIDTAIVGPFLLVFFIGPLVLGGVAAVAHLGEDHRTALAFIGAAIGIQLVMVAITVRVNVPLNDGIKAAGDPGTIDVSNARRKFNERRWVRWNNVRALAATLAFGAMLLALIQSAGS